MPICPRSFTNLEIHGSSCFGLDTGVADPFRQFYKISGFNQNLEWKFMTSTPTNIEDELWYPRCDRNLEFTIKRIQLSKILKEHSSWLNLQTYEMTLLTEIRTLLRQCCFEHDFFESWINNLDHLPKKWWMNLRDHLPHRYLGGTSCLLV